MIAAKKNIIVAKAFSKKNAQVPIWIPQALLQAGVWTGKLHSN